MSVADIPAPKIVASAALTPPAIEKTTWSKGEKFLFRLLFIFSAVLILPVDPDWYSQFFNSRSFFWYLSSIAGYRTNLIQLPTESGRWGIGGYATWGIALLIALAGAGLWTLIARKSKRTNYNALYYWTRVAIRYRIALGIIAFGFLKVYPMQMPYPSTANLLTDFGDYNTYKIYWQHVGVTVWYEILLGWVEVLGGVLLFFRGTTFFGALINAGVLFNIAHANLAYDGGVHVYSSFFVLFALVLLVPYVIQIWKLFILRQEVTPGFYYPKLGTKTKKISYYTAKIALVLLFTVVYGILRYQVHYREGYLKEPVNPGLSHAAGVYNVTEFRINNQVVPYDPLDSVRWEHVVFEKWSTLVYKVNKPYAVSLANGTPSQKDVDRNYELAGIAGGQRFLYYDADTVKHILYLKDKNGRNSREDGGGKKEQNNKNATAGAAKKGKDSKDEKPLLVWSYERPAAGRIILKGLNEKKDSIYVVLDRIDRKFPIQVQRSNQ